MCGAKAAEQVPAGAGGRRYAAQVLLSTMTDHPATPPTAAVAEGPRIQGEFKAATADIDRRHGDPKMGGLSSGEKVSGRDLSLCWYGQWQCCKCFKFPQLSLLSCCVVRRPPSPAAFATAMSWSLRRMHPPRSRIPSSATGGWCGWVFGWAEVDRAPEIGRSPDAAQGFLPKAWSCIAQPSTLHINPRSCRNSPWCCGQNCREEQAGKSTPENADARADNPLSNPKNMEAQGNA